MRKLLTPVVIDNGQAFGGDGLSDQWQTKLHGSCGRTLHILNGPLRQHGVSSSGVIILGRFCGGMGSSGVKSAQLTL